jgi:hypothetical protein
MRRAGALAWTVGVVTALGLAMQLHCGGSGGSQFESPCDTVYSGQCGKACTVDRDCASRMYCGQGACKADCVQGGAACAEGLTCTANGACLAMGTGFDDDGGLMSTDARGRDGANGGDSCVDVVLKLAKVTPTVLLLIDQSSSMNDAFPADKNAGSKWNVLRNALLDPKTGIIEVLQNDVDFGLALYSGDNSGCPLLTTVNYAIGNYAAIDAIYATAKPIDNTPTGESILSVIGYKGFSIDARGHITGGSLGSGGLGMLSTAGPKVIILATDGDPDTCAAPNSNGTDPPKEVSVEATQIAFKNGIKTYVIAVGDEVSVTHQQEVANAGVGLAPTASPGAPYYVTSNGGDLIAAINKIVYGVRSCRFTLNGTVTAGSESLGTVLLNGKALRYMDPNGWHLNGASELEVVGTACDTIKTSDATLSVSFPCDAATILR